MPPAGFEPATPADKRPQTYALDPTNIGINSVTPIQQNSVRYHSMTSKSSKTINIVLGNYV
jgi:hypothetical protein